MAYRLKFIVLIIALSSVGILILEELVTHTAKLPKNGYRKRFQKDDSSFHDLGSNRYQHASINGAREQPEILSSAHRKPAFWNKPPDSLQPEVTTARSVETVEREHAQRVENLLKVCKSETTKRRFEQRKANLTQFYYDKRHKFAYCKVPKSGSTFWMKVFMVMIKGGNYSKVLSSMSRREIHGRATHFRVHPVQILRRNVPTIIVSRNPFSRLYSAYVDKVFLPLFWENFASMPSVNVLPQFDVNVTIDVLRSSNKPLSARLARYRESMLARGMLYHKHVRRRIRPICANDASFEDFLKFIIEEVKAGHALEPHWAPISHLCHPCRFNVFSIVKQETFASDVEHTLGSLGIDLNEFDWLKSTLHENRVQNSAPGIVAVLDFNLKLLSVNTCISPKEAIARLWKAFQIQGFIRDDVDVPADIASMEKFRKDVVTGAVLKAVNENPMTSSESSRQRHTYLSAAYRSVSEETLSEIQKIFYLDFALFGYPFSPPYD